MRVECLLSKSVLLYCAPNIVIVKVCVCCISASVVSHSTSGIRASTVGVGSVLSESTIRVKQRSRKFAGVASSLPVIIAVCRHLVGGAADRIQSRTVKKARTCRRLTGRRATQWKPWISQVRLVVLRN